MSVIVRQLTVLLKSYVYYLIVLSKIDGGVYCLVDWLVGCAGDQIQYMLDKHYTTKLHLEYKVLGPPDVTAGTFTCVPIFSVFNPYTLMVHYQIQSCIYFIISNDLQDTCFLQEAEVAELKVQSQLWLVANTSNPSTWELEEEESGDKSHSQLTTKPVQVT